MATKQTKELLKTAEETFDCCGLGLHYVDDRLETYPNPNKTDKEWSDVHGVGFKEGSLCFNHSSLACPTCYTTIEENVGKGFNTAGGLGLFFSFPEVRLLLKINFTSFAITKLIIDNIIDPWGYLYPQIQAFNKRYGRVCLKLVLTFLLGLGVNLVALNTENSKLKPDKS